MTTPSEPRPPSEEPRRRPFDGQTSPEPFHRSPEFVRFIWLAGGLVVVVLMVFYAASIGGKKITSAQAPAPAPAAARADAPPADVDPMARSVRLSTLFEGALVDSHNGEGFAETEGYRKLLQTLSTYPADQVEKLATQKLDWTAATNDPDAWRGQFVWTRGVIAHRWAERLRSPVFAAQDVYRVILTDGDGSEGVVIDMLEEPPAVALQSDPVDVQGIFYRTIRYAAVGQKEDRVAPYLLAKSMRAVERPKRNVGGVLRDHGATALAGMALAIGAARLLIYWFQRRSRRLKPPRRPAPVGFEKMFENRLREGNRTSGPRSQA
ncbi:MAG TPA: hypothetical protein VGR31_13830 [Planctomycetota bacterium]|jgi:hypothetical protein|nr:hypothetical protein [Planctomycetota bacterium]